MSIFTEKQESRFPPGLMIGHNYRIGINKLNEIKQQLPKVWRGALKRITPPNFGLLPQQARRVNRNDVRRSAQNEGEPAGACI
ncbi:hypothetical protein ACPPVU_11760 [Mucilaginibacter sp. McL0603]|uniref:hypothetical protein n=1 Tax=Mucilaginibacter sp. McL0603 TaxID=3415670 RepID=UPI003CF8B904